MERFEIVKENIGSGNFGVARLLRDKKTKELVAVKYIERGPKVPNIMSFCGGGTAYLARCNWRLELPAIQHPPTAPS